jgi:glycosyltransferase involved in cell wall biosynthesis
MVIQSFRPVIGGGERQLERLLPYLAARGVAADVVTRGYPAHPSSEQLPSGRLRRTLVPGRSPVASIVFVLQSLAYIARRRRRFDVVHAHAALSEGTIALGASLLGVPGIVTIFRTGYWGDFERLALKPGGRLRTRWLTRRMWFIALSRESREELEGLGAPAARILEIPNGVDLRTYHPPDADERRRLRLELGLDPERPVGLFVGRLEHVKEVDTLIRALPPVPELQLLVVGDGDERERLESLAEREKVAERVHFVGFTDEVPRYLRSADVFLLPSRSEGMSNALLEAMACGLPCVGTHASGVPELLADGRGLIVDAGDVSAWTATMLRLAGDEALRRRLGGAAAAYVQANHSLESIADSLVAAYERVTRAGSDRRGKAQARAPRRRRR